jgi:hypothetical protein
MLEKSDLLITIAQFLILTYNKNTKSMPNYKLCEF